MAYTDYVNMDLATVSSDLLLHIQEELIEEHNNIMAQYAESIKKIATPNFDPYSFFGERKIKKIASKYADDLSNIEVLLDDIDDELNKREDASEPEPQSNEEYERDTKEEREEFVKSESDKTQKIRQDNKL